MLSKAVRKTWVEKGPSAVSSQSFTLTTKRLRSGKEIGAVNSNSALAGLLSCSGILGRWQKLEETH